MKLREVLDSIAKKMLADFDASGAVQHRGSKGTVRESNLLDNYLSKYLPRSVTAVHGGEAITVDGEVSAQSDIMILDPTTPPFWDEGDYRVVPIECVHGVIEVKSFLDSTQLRDAWTKIARIKRMSKKAFRSNPGYTRTRTVYGKVWNHVPICGLIFGYDGADLGTLGTTLAELAEEEDEGHPEYFVDSVWVLNKGAWSGSTPTTAALTYHPNPVLP